MGCGGSKSTAVTSRPAGPYPVQQSTQPRQTVHQAGNGAANWTQPQMPPSYQQTQNIPQHGYPQAYTQAPYHQPPPPAYPAHTPQPPPPAYPAHTPQSGVTHVQQVPQPTPTPVPRPTPKGTSTAYPTLPEEPLSADEEAKHEAALVTISRSEFISHNEQCCQNRTPGELWTVDSKKVYRGQALFHVLLPVIKEHIQTIEEKGDSWDVYEMKSLQETIESSQTFNMSAFYATQFRLPASKIKAAKQVTVVGKIVDDEEFKKKHRQQLDEVLSTLNLEEDELSDVLRDFADLIERYQHQHGHSRSENTPGIELNSKVFSLPDKIIPEHMRIWLTDWELFDHEIDEDGYAWQSPIVDDVVETEDPHEHFKKTVRSWINDWETFDLDIPGEAAWEVVPLDIVRHDEATEEQLSLLKLREADPTFGDVEKMEARRKALCAYFYNLDEVDVSSVNVEWANSMATSWKQFQELCEQ